MNEKELGYRATRDVIGIFVCVILFIVGIVFVFLGEFFHSVFTFLVAIVWGIAFMGGVMFFLDFYSLTFAKVEKDADKQNHEVEVIIGKT